MSKKRPGKKIKISSKSGLESRLPKKRKASGRIALITGLTAVITVLSLLLLIDPKKKDSHSIAADVKTPPAESRPKSFDEPAAKGISYHLKLDKIKPFMETYCYSCHNAKKQKGDVRLDNLPETMVTDADAQLWQDALDAVNLGIMVPEEAKKIPDTLELENFIAALTEELENARRAFGDSGGEVVMHRLNRREYVNTIKDLLNVTVNAKTLPQDGQYEGFDTVGQSLYFSSLHFDRYLETGMAVIKQIIHKGKKPQFVTKKIDGEWKFEKAKKQLAHFQRRRDWLKKQMDMGKTWKDLRYNSPADLKKAYDYTALVIKRWGIFSKAVGHDTGYLTYRVDHPITQHWKIPIPPVDVEGDYVLKIRCAVTGIPGEKRPKKTELLHLIDQTINDGEPDDKLRFYNITAPYSNPEIIEYKFRMIPGQKREIDINGKHLNNYQLWLDWAEWSGPHNVQWPSPGYKALFFKGEQEQKSDNYAKAIIENFAVRAFRGQKPLKGFIDTLHGLYLKHRKTKSFEESLVMPLGCILASPKFIYKFESKRSAERKLSQLEVANRLSFFLWNSMPDNQLNKMAGEGKLQGESLKKQVVRMIKDPRSHRFAESFTEQWLDLHELNGLDIEPAILESARKEPVAFFNELLQSNQSYTNFIDSDFAVVDQTLAKHYGIPGSKREFSRVKLPSGSVRGGLLGQAAFLIMTSEGKRTSIVQRGTWILRKILHAPPPPPPPNVPQLEVKKMKKMNPRQLLEAHNSIAQCRSCHKRIDPLGYPLEIFDFLGRQRNLTGRNKMDITGRMPDGKRTFNNFAELKKRMLEDKERTLRGLIESLLIYSLGRPLSFADQGTVEDMIKQSRSGGQGMRSIIESIVLSPVFSVK